jgi:hypothetical protein
MTGPAPSDAFGPEHSQFPEVAVGSPVAEQPGVNCEEAEWRTLSPLGHSR